MTSHAIAGRYNTNQVIAMTWMFSPKVIKELAQTGKSATFGRLIKTANLWQNLPNPRELRIRDAYDIVYNVLKDGNNRSAYIYKNVLTRKRFLGIHSLKTASLLTEFRVGKSKADVVILNGTSTAYEIKSERDTFFRLSGQIDSYLDVFDKVYVISSEDNSEQLMSILSNQVGVMALNKRQCITTIRKALSNKDSISPSVFFDSLTREEAEAVLKLYNIDIPKVPNTRIRSELKSLFFELGASRVHDGAVTVLKQSRSLSPLSDFLFLLPDSLKAVGVSTLIPHPARETLINTLDLSLHTAYRWS